MSEKLFRQEALDAMKSRTFGSIAIYCPPYRWVVIALVIIITISTIAFLYWGSYTRREMATGELLPVTGVLNVVTSTKGTVSQLFVSEGQHVKKGEPLAEISSEISTRLGDAREHIASQLQMQQLRLEEELVNLAKLNEETTAGLKNRIQLLSAQLTQLETQQRQRTKQVTLSANQLTKIQQMLNQGYASRTQAEEQETAHLEAQSRLQEIMRLKLDTQQQYEQAKQQLREQPLSELNRRSDIERRLSENRQSLIENESLRSVILTAPQNSIVGAVLTQRGKMVASSQTLFSLLPTGEKLRAQLMVNSRAIGFIRPGQKVVLRYQAYPYQKFGHQYGVVASVSKTALSPQEVAILIGNNNVQEQHFRVFVELEKQNIQAYGKPEELKPGMALEADFLIDKRRLYEWILEPLFALGRRLAV